MTWFQGVPGLDCREQPGDPQIANLSAALACAARLRPVTPRPGRVPIQSTPTGKAARLFLNWLQDTKDDAEEAYRRRFALALALETPGDATPEHALATARTLRSWLKP